MKKYILNTLAAALVLSSLSCCSRGGATPTPEPPTGPGNPPPTAKNEVDVWITKYDQSALLAKQTGVVAFSSQSNSYPYIDLNINEKFQTVDGFGYTLTGGSVEVINRLGEAKKNELLTELFSSGENAISVNYIRLSIGASDLNSEVFSYNDLAPGETDSSLSKFSLEKDRAVITMLKQILTLNPNIKIMAAPWSPPTWMKDNKSSIGGHLLPEYYSVYAQYFVKYIQEMKKEGITIDAITPQNEPLHPGNNPSLEMLAKDQADFIKNHLGPAFKNAGITTKIVIYDHNLDRLDYPISILQDPTVAQYVDGTAFHLYAGDINSMKGIHDTFPTKNLYFTEQYTASTGEFGGDLNWHLRNVIIGSMRNWSKTALEWNLANDANFKPHTPGGCTTCKGAITINNSSSYTRNVGYYIVGHASKFVPTGSQRISSTETSDIKTVAFLRPDGKIVLIVQNGSSRGENFNIRIGGKWATVALDAGAIGTFVF